MIPIRGHVKGGSHVNGLGMESKGSFRGIYMNDLRQNSFVQQISNTPISKTPMYLNRR